MSYGYLGVTPNQKVANNGVFSITEVNDLIEQGSWGGSLELIQSQTVSSVSTVTFTSIKESKYDVHFLQCTNYQPAGNDYLSMRFYESGVLESGSVYKHALQYGYLSGAFGENKGTSQTSLRFLPDSTSTSTDSAQGYAYIYNAGNSSQYTYYSQHTMGQDFFWYGGGVLPQTSTVDGIYLFGADTGSNIVGTFNLYGVKQT